jgi:HD-like signal output (HDOD) protein/ActR/RegA family two-component response regulator
MKKRILFVDDEPRVLDGLRRTLHCMVPEWDMAFVEGGEQALEAFSKQPFDVVVTDMRMPRMSGNQLLHEVMTRWPRVVRLVLSGHSDEQMILQTVTTAHQYLSKPCDPEKLKAAIGRATRLRDVLSEGPVGDLVGRLSSLPSLPQVYLELAQELRSPDSSLCRIGGIISKDIGMTAKVLQLVNSAFFGLPQRITDPAQAINLLGLETVRSLMLTVHVFSEFRHEELSGLSSAALWSHSVAVSTYARRIAEMEKADKKTTNDSFAAGILHDAGKLVLAANLPRKYAEALALARKEDKSLSEAETQVFGATHAEVGAYLLALWAFPDPVVEALAFHHRPSGVPPQGFSPLVAVYVADCLDHRLGPGVRAAHEPQIDLDYMGVLGLADRIPQWTEALQSSDEQRSRDASEDPIRR